MFNNDSAYTANDLKSASSRVAKPSRLVEPAPRLVEPAPRLVEPAPRLVESVPQKDLFIGRFRCGFCGQAFESEDLFLYHLREHHIERKKAKIIKVEHGVTIKTDSIDDIALSSDILSIEELVSVDIKQENQPYERKNEIGISMKQEQSEPNIDLKCLQLPSVKAMHYSDTFNSPKRSLREVLCSRVKSSGYDFGESLVSHDSETSFFDCTECCFRAKSSDALTDHITALHTQKIFQLIKERETTYNFDCAKCCFRAQNNEALQNHIRVQHPPPQIGLSEKIKSRALECTYCCFRAQTNEALTKHFNVLHRETEFTSTIEEREWSQYFDCSQCCFRGQDEEALQKHVSALHPGLKRRKTINCDKCNFSSSSLLQLAFHTKELHSKFLHCSECNFKTVFQSQLNKHANAMHPQPEQSGSETEKELYDAQTEDSDDQTEVYDAQTDDSNAQREDSDTQPED